MTRIQKLQGDTSRWSDSVFGSHRLATAPLRHLVLEVQEVLAAPDDHIEYADCLLLLIDAYRMAGGTANQLVEIAFAKLEINKTRTWSAPNADGVCTHL